MIRPNEILFKNRNKLYGAYDLRKKYPTYAITGLIGSVIILASILAFVYYLIYFDEFASLAKNDYLPDVNELITLQQLNLPDIEQLKKPEDLKPKEVQGTPVIAKDADEPDISETNSKNITTPIDSSGKDKDIADIDSSKKQDSEKDEVSEILNNVDEMPEYMQGSDELRKFIAKNTVYPDSAFKQKIQGVVLVQFIVTKHGEVKNLKLVRSVSPLLDSEAMRVARMINTWKPGRQKGKAVNVQYVIPFNFKI
jgi:protein TonB